MRIYFNPKSLFITWLICPRSEQGDWKHWQIGSNQKNSHPVLVSLHVWRFRFKLHPEQNSLLVFSSIGFLLFGAWQSSHWPVSLRVSLGCKSQPSSKGETCSCPSCTSCWTLLALVTILLPTWGGGRWSWWCQRKGRWQSALKYSSTFSQCECFYPLMCLSLTRKHEQNEDTRKIGDISIYGGWQGVWGEWGFQGGEGEGLVTFIAYVTFRWKCYKNSPKRCAEEVLPRQARHRKGKHLHCFEWLKTVIREASASKKSISISILGCVLSSLKWYVESQHDFPLQTFVFKNTFSIFSSYIFPYSQMEDGKCERNIFNFFLFHFPKWKMGNDNLNPTIPFFPFFFFHFSKWKMQMKL